MTSQFSNLPFEICNLLSRRSGPRPSQLVPLPRAYRGSAGRVSEMGSLAVALAILSVLAAAEVILPSAAGSQAGRGAAPMIGAAAVGFELKTLDGQRVRLETFSGRPLIMNFFASWCDPCREEMPLINALASKADENGYAVLGVAIQDRRAWVMEFAREAGVVFPVALDLNSKVQRAYRVLGPPTTFFIDAQGVIRDIVMGPVTPDRAHRALEKAGVPRSVLAGP